MQNSSDNGFFSFLIGDTLREVASIVVTVPDGALTLSDSLESVGRVRQVTIENVKKWEARAEAAKSLAVDVFTTP